jgi:RNA polymerase sigma factor (sigma-70 family)
LGAPPGGDLERSTHLTGGGNLSPDPALVDVMSVLERTLTDAEAMGRVREGDWDAFAALVDRHRTRLERYLARLAGSRDAGEELAQEAFVRLWLAASRYREEGRFEAYLYRIGTRLAQRAARRQRRAAAFRLTFGRTGTAVDGEPASEPLFRDEIRREVERALERLPIPFRAPLVLAVMEERSHAEIAELLGLRLATVKTRLFRARLRLRAELEPYVTTEKRQ